MCSIKSIDIPSFPVPVLTYTWSSKCPLWIILLVYKIMTSDLLISLLLGIWYCNKVVLFLIRFSFVNNDYLEDERKISLMVKWMAVFFRKWRASLTSWRWRMMKGMSFYSWRMNRWPMWLASVTSTPTSRCHSMSKKKKAFTGKGNQLLYLRWSKITVFNSVPSNLYINVIWLLEYFSLFFKYVYFQLGWRQN